MPQGPVGLIANPASGKDIRRLVARASVFDNQEKRAIVRRAIAGAVAGGATGFYYMPDTYGIVAEAFADDNPGVPFTAVDSPETETALDTIRAARGMLAAECGAVITLGGDGTNRAVALGWRDVPLVAISTGTNNVFPRMIEGTVAGAAAGLVASGAVDIADVQRQAKIVLIEIDGERDDVALIDAVFVAEQFVGSRAIWDSGRLRFALFTRAEPAAVGLSSIGGLLQPVGEEDDYGLAIHFGKGSTVYAPLAPGLYRHVSIASFQRQELGAEIALEGPGVLAFDGERDRVLKDGQRARLRVVREGPRVIDIDRTLQLAARRGLFRDRPIGGTDGD